MTKRQWVIVQTALLQLDDANDKGDTVWDEDEDGELPTHEEIAEVAEIVGNMIHDA